MTRRILERIARSRLLGKSPFGAYLRLNDSIWKRLPRWLTNLRPVVAYGRWMHALVCLQGDRKQYLGTFFFRNRPELELIRRLTDPIAHERPVRMAVLGCSNGAEVYSIAWSIRSGRDLKVFIHAVDISPEVLGIARAGRYSPAVSELVREPVFERMTASEMEGMFERRGEELQVRSWLQEGIAWHLGDVRDPRMHEDLGRQDVVVANGFLCHMEPPEAEGCLRNIARLVDPGGFLVVSAIDLAVRTKVARDLGWRPLRDLMQQIHDGDASLRRSWPWKYWGLEPFDARRADWEVRYASAFQLGERR